MLEIPNWVATATKDEVVARAVKLADALLGAQLMGQEALGCGGAGCCLKCSDDFETCDLYRAGVVLVEWQDGPGADPARAAQTIRVVVVEAGAGFTDKRAEFMLDLAGDEDRQAMVAKAMQEAAARGFRVMANTDGGCCEYCSVSTTVLDEQSLDYIGVTVYPEEE